MDANQCNFVAAVKSDSAKITSRKLTCSTVERWMVDLKKKFDISYFVVKEELPLAKYEKLIALKKRHGVSHG